MIELRFRMGLWTVYVDGLAVRSFKTNATANRHAAHLRGDVR